MPLDYCKCAKYMSAHNARGYTNLVMISNDIFISKALDCIEMIKKKNCYVRNIKKLTNQLESLIKKYDKEFNRGLTNAEDFANVSQYMEDYLKNDMFILEMAIKKRVDEYNVKENILMCNCCSMMILSFLNNTLVEQVKSKYGAADAKNFSIHGIQNMAFKLCVELCKLYRCCIDVNDPEILKCVVVIVNNICDGKVMHKALNYAND